MGQPCMHKESDKQEVYAELFDKVYEDVDKASHSKEMESIKTNRYLYLKAIVERKGAVRKLNEHLESHKNRLRPCVSYMLTFRANPLRTVEQATYQAALLIVLQTLTKHIGSYTKDHTFVKRRNSDLFKLGLEKQNTRPASIMSDSLAKAYELSVIDLFAYLQHVPNLDEGQRACYVSCIKEFSTYAPFKFQKQTIALLLQLSLSLLSTQGLQDPSPQWLLISISSLLSKLNLQTEFELLAAVFERVLLLDLNRDDYDATLKAQIDEILGHYESLLHQSRYIKLYSVLLQVVEGQLLKTDLQTASRALFRLGFSHMVLLPLLAAATQGSSGTFQQLSNKKYRNQMFKVVLDYLKWGYTCRKQLLVLPIREICLCLISNCCLINIKVNELTCSLVKFFIEAQLDPYQIFKELLGIFDEQCKTYPESLLRCCFGLLNIVLTQAYDEIDSSYQEEICRIFCGKAFRLTDSPSYNFVLLETLRLLFSLNELHTDPQAQYYNHLLTLVCHDFCRFLATDYNEVDCEILYGCGLKGCSILQELAPHKPNLFLAVLTRLLQLYDDALINSWFKLGYYAIIKRLSDQFPGIVNRNSQSDNLLRGFKFAYSIDSPNSNLTMLNVMKSFRKKQLSLQFEKVRKVDGFDIKIYKKFMDILSLRNPDETAMSTDSEQPNHQLIIRNRASSKESISHQQVSIASIMAALQD